MKKRQARLFLWGGLMAAVLAGSVITYLVMDGSQVNRVLFFPEDGTGHTAGERRRLPRRDGDENSIQLLVEELILGPVELSLNPLLPKHTSVRTCMLRDRIVYLDLSPELVVAGSETGLSVEESLHGIERTIRFNYPRVEDIIFFIDGEMYAPEVSGAGF